MKVLFLTYQLPHEDVVGGHRIVFQRIRYLAEAGYDVGLLSFTTTEASEQKDSLKPYVRELHTIPEPNRSVITRVFHDYLEISRPALFWKRYSKQMMRTVGDVVDAGQYDVVIAEFSEMGQYLYRNPYLSAVHKLISCHRCLTASYEKYKDLGEVRWRLHLKSIPQLFGLERYEFNMYRSADRTLVFTPQDRFTIQYYAQDLAVSVSPSGVDVNYLQAVPPVPKEPIILMTGFMGDPANEDSAKWFYHHIWPALSRRHPDLKFFLVGAGPSDRLKRMFGQDPGVVITGQVEDIRPYRNRAQIFVSPVRLGSGIRTKVLEAMASGLPVVSTSLGLAGIEAQTGHNCLVADTADLFIQSIEWLLTDRTLSAQIASNARALVEKKHSLESGLKQFEKILKSVVEG